MPTKRLSMRRIQRLMTLHFGAGAPTRAIARELGISHSTVREYLARIAAAQPFRIEGSLPQREASFDVGQLEQVMINLLKNAAESGSPPEGISVGVHPRAQGFLIEVADRGTGLSEQVLRDALLPFFSTKPSGTGLGLTLCREIVEAHGGRLTLANRPDGGAIVSIHLP